MSMDFCFRIGKKCLDEEQIEDIIRDYFKCGNKLKKEDNRGNVVYSGFTEGNQLLLFFTAERKPPYNAYESGILGRDYVSEQSIIISPDMSKRSPEMIKEILRFFIYIQSRIDSDALVEGEYYDEICLITDEGVTWADNELISVSYTHLTLPTT